MKNTLVSILSIALFLLVTPAQAALTVTAGNPILVVAGADDDEGTIVSLTKEFHIMFMTFTPTDIGDSCEVQDAAGGIIFVFDGGVVAGQELMTVVFPEGTRKVTGLKIDTNDMDTGTLRIYLYPN